MSQTSQSPTVRLGALQQFVFVSSRMMLGYMWMNAGLDKVKDGWAWDMLPTVHASLGHTYGFYLPFITNVVLPHQPLFDALVTSGECAAGASLLVGAGARFGAIVAMFLSLNYAWLQGRPLYYFSGWDSVYFWMAALAFAGASGRIVGIDRFLYRKWPLRWFW